MPFAMKIQPIDCYVPEANNFEPVKPLVKSRFKRLFERQFPSVLRMSVPEKASGDEQSRCNKDGTEEFEPSSLHLAEMVQDFIEDDGDRQSRCGRNRYNCFNGNSNSSSEDEMDSTADACGILKNLISSTSVHERNLLAETSRIVEKNKIWKRKDDFSRKIVADGLLAHGYDAAICKSRWEKSSYPAGEYEYVDVMIGGERLIVDIDFRSEFEIARSTKPYKAILQTLPHIFVGKSDRLQRIISLVSEAAKQSLKKKGMPLPPWRRADYVKSKWLSPVITRTSPNSGDTDDTDGEFELIFGEEDNGDNSGMMPPVTVVVKEREIKAKTSPQVGGLAYVIETNNNNP